MRKRAAVAIVVLVYLVSFVPQVGAEECCSHESSQIFGDHHHEHDAASDHRARSDGFPDKAGNVQKLALDHVHCCGSGHHVEGSQAWPSIITRSTRISLTSVCPGDNQFLMALGCSSSGIISGKKPFGNSHTPPKFTSVESLLTVILLI